MEAVNFIGRLISAIVLELEPECGQLYTRILKTGEAQQRVGFDNKYFST